MIMVLFFRGDFGFCFADSLSCRMAASATGSVPFSTSSSAKKGSFQRGGGKTGENRAETGRVCPGLKIHRNGITTINCPPPSNQVLSFPPVTHFWRKGTKIELKNLFHENKGGSGSLDKTPHYFNALLPCGDTGVIMTYHSHEEPQF